QVHQHHRIRDARVRDVDASLGDDGRMPGLVSLALARHGSGEDRVGGILDEGRSLRLVDLMVLQPVGVAPKLLFDPVRGAVERDLWLATAVRSLEHDPIHDRRDDVAGVVVVRTSAEGDVGSHGPGKIFFRDVRDSTLRMLAQRLAGIDLMTRDPNVHLWLAPSLLRALRTAPVTPSTGPLVLRREPFPPPADDS